MKPMKVSKGRGEALIMRGSDRFDGDIFKNVFDRHVKDLNKMKQEAMPIYHSVMSRLYTQVT